MDIRDFLSRLQGVKPSGNGQYMAKCPAHEDKKASLGVALGDNGSIVLKCMAGCSTADVLSSMGLKMADLYPEQCKPEGKRRSAKPKPTVKPSSPDEESGAQKTELEPQVAKHIDKTYDYTDEKGQIVFQVVRYVPKDFRQRKPGKYPGTWDWSIKGCRQVIYHLPDVVKAIAEERPIYLVEGEKDADNMALLGYVATTSAMGAGKWKQEHSEQLRGAKVYILPDNDKPGAEHAQQVANALMDVAKSVSVLDIKHACPSLPEKGDITDFFKILGKEAGMKALEKLTAKAVEYTAPEKQLSMADSAQDERTQFYAETKGYSISEGCTCLVQGDGTLKKLATFCAVPREMVTKDDGVNTERFMTIDGWDVNGRKLPAAMISTAKFNNMQWLLDSWGFAANIAPGNMTWHHLRYAIMDVGSRFAKERTVYTHTGWRSINGKMAYLYAGGAIGADNVSVELDGSLGNYDLSLGKELDLSAANDLSLTFRSFLPMKIAVPLQGLMYLAPLREFLEQQGVAPAFTLFVVGGTSSGKSTVTALALSHFGNFNIRAFPASFHDTANSIRRKAFVLKDVPLVVDDYHPVSNMKTRRTMEDIAQNLARAYGDGADRGRLNADMALAKAMPPRGVAIMSGEDLPNIAESGSSRYYIVRLERGDVEKDKILTELQEKAREGYLARAMRGYIEWLLPQTDKLPAQLAKRFSELRQRAREEMEGVHDRLPEAVAHIMLGYELMLQYMQASGNLEAEDYADFWDMAWKEITTNSVQQGAESADERPSRLFLRTIGELLAAKKAQTIDLMDMKASVPQNMVGYMDTQYYYLLPELAYAAISELMQKEGVAFPLSKNQLLKQLLADKLCVSGGDGCATKVKKIYATPKRLLWIPRHLIDGGEPPAVQTVMPEVFPGLVPVEDDQNTPF